MMMGGSMMMGQPQPQPPMMMNGPPPYNMNEWNPPMLNGNTWMCQIRANGQWVQYLPDYKIWLTMQDCQSIFNPNLPPQHKQYFINQFQQTQAWFMQVPQFNPQSQMMNMGGMGAGMNMGGMNMGGMGGMNMGGMNMGGMNMGGGMNVAARTPSPSYSGGMNNMGGMGQPQQPQQQQPGQGNNANVAVWTPELMQRLYQAQSVEEIEQLFENVGWDTALWQSQFSINPDAIRQEFLNMVAAYFTTKVVPSKMEIECTGADSIDLEKYSTTVIERPFLNENLDVSPNVTGVWTAKAHPDVAHLESIATNEIAPPDESKRIFTCTEVRVGNISALDLAGELRSHYDKNKYRIAVLNMTHPQHPGGSWRKGQFSQEETNFVQSCLSASLDDTDYPLDDFALRYSKDVPVVRNSQDYGYVFLKDNERWSVDFVSICGINLAKKGAVGASQFTSEVAVRTRAKVEAILSACVANGATIVVLGALGCGAFCNPPDYVAAIFKAVLEQYAGFFERVYFAILGESAGVFANILIGPGTPAEQIESANDIEGIKACYPHPPPDWVMTTTDVKKPLCEYCGNCTDISPEHRQGYCHPPECPAGINCQNMDERHRYMLAHTQQDIQAGRIKTAESAAAAAAQQQAPAGGCQECADGTTCRLIFDKEHMKNFNHQFLPPCPNIFTCMDQSNQHMTTFSHFCPNGNMCSALTNPEHFRYFVHTGMMCMNQQCNDISEEHLSAYMHPGIPAVRPPCTLPFCNDFTINHRRCYSHHPYNKMGNSVVRMLNTRNPNSNSYGDFSESKEYVVDFVEGTSYWLSCLDRHPQGPLSVDSPNVRSVMQWMSTLRPVNMCSAEVLKSVARLGIVGSNVRLQNLWGLRDDIADFVLSRKSIQGLYPWDHNSMKRTRKYCKKYIRIVQGDISSKKVVECNDKLRKAMAVDPGNTPGGNQDDNEAQKQISKYQKLIATYQTTPQVSGNKKSAVSEARVNLSEFLRTGGRDSEAIIKAIEAEVPSVLDAITSLLENLSGVNFSVDEKVCTNHTVFAIVGPHMDNYGGAEVVLIFNKTIMYHPDYYMLPNAATLYGFGQAHKAKYKYGPEMNRFAWMGPSKPFDGGGRELLRLEKFHPIDPRWEEAAAKEFIFQTAQYMKKRPADVTLPEVIKFWKLSNSHCVIEGHLPSAVTLDYVEYAILQRSAYNKLKAAGGESAALLSEWESRPGFLKIVENAAEAKTENAEYFMKHPPTNVPRGFTFVISGADTKELFMPYKMNESAEKVVIKYGALGGKFFVTLSNIGDLSYKGVNRETITFGLNKEMSVMSAYYSPPANCVSERAAASTDNFSVGCNTEDFVCYQIVIDYKARTGTIMHDGHSAMYNSAAVTVSLGNAPRYSYISFSSPINAEPRPRIINLNFGY